METYADLFEAYLRDMRAAMAASTRWWEQLQDGETVRLGDAARAGAELAERWPFGAASHPFVIAAYRKWGLECQRLNDDWEARADDDGEDDEDAGSEDDWGEDESPFSEDEPENLATLEGPVEPRDLLIDMLPGRADDVAAFLEDFVFDPLGLDEDERWV